MISRARALSLLSSHLTEPTLVKHSLASEAIMRHLARRLGEDEERWGLAGLLHDLDFERTRADMPRHGMAAAEELAAEGVDEPVLHAIRAHNQVNTGVLRESKLDFALTAAESITGLVVATALVQPDKKLASVKASSVLKRMKQPAFARSVDREEIKLCERVGLDLEAFTALALEAMAGVAPELGL